MSYYWRFLCDALPYQYYTTRVEQILEALRSSDRNADAETTSNVENVPA